MVVMTKSPVKIKICSLHEILMLIPQETAATASNTENETPANEGTSQHHLQQQDVIYDLESIAAKRIMAKEFVIYLPGSQNKLDIFIVARQHSDGLQLFCYKNQCPHTLINLNWQPDQFLSLDRSRIQCSMHGALFRINDGFCEWGPCQGMSLQNLLTTIENDDVFIWLK